MSTRKLIVPRDGKKPRLEAYLTRALPGMSDGRARLLVAKGRVRIGGRLAKAGRILWGGESVEVELEPPQPTTPERGPQLEVLLERPGFLIIHKPPGLVVERPDGAPSVVGLMSGQAQGWDVEGRADPGVVHRLDRETSGCLLLARSDDGAAMLRLAFEEKRIQKTYRALVLGTPKDEDRLDTPFGKNPDNPRLYSSRVSSPRRAVLSYRTVERLPTGAALEVDLETGRTHQIRVQLSDVGLPVLADPLYGPREVREHPASRAVGRLALHAHRLQLKLEAETITVEAPLPEDLQRGLQALREAT